MLHCTVRHCSARVYRKCTGPTTLQDCVANSQHSCARQIGDWSPNRQCAAGCGAGAALRQSILAVRERCALPSSDKHASVPLVPAARGCHYAGHLWCGAGARDAMKIAHGLTYTRRAGNFSAPRAQEIIVARGKVLELLRPDDSGKLHSVVAVDTFSNIRSIAPFRLTGVRRAARVSSRNVTHSRARALRCLACILTLCGSWQSGLHRGGVRLGPHRSAAVQPRQERV